MTQLRQEGWIHHQARRAVACFLTRGDLWISWECGMKVEGPVPVLVPIQVQVQVPVLVPVQVQVLVPVLVQVPVQVPVQFPVQVPVQVPVWW